MPDTPPAAPAETKRTISNDVPGFGWRLDYPNTLADCMQLTLVAPSGKDAATVFLHRDVNGFNWFVWDEEGVGGENDSQPTVVESMYEAEQATKRWGQHAPAPSPAGTGEHAQLIRQLREAGRNVRVDIDGAMDAGGLCARAAAALASQGEEVGKLKAIVDKLHRTVDGVPIVPGMTVHELRVGRSWKVRGIVVDDGGEWASLYGTDKGFVRVTLDDLYASRDARDAALATAHPSAGDAAASAKEVRHE